MGEMRDDYNYKHTNWGLKLTQITSVAESSDY